jgi:cation diffusion facilitator CzcD-associated flavoprotein CzcO
VYFTSRWPHDPVDFTGKRVAVIGTGSSGVQSIPVIAQKRATVVVFQRTPTFCIPAHNGPLSPESSRNSANEAEYRAAARVSPGRHPEERSITPTFSVSETLNAQDAMSAHGSGPSCSSVHRATPMS